MITAAAMSTSITDTMYLVYGYPINRFTGVTAVISSGDRATGNHANGFAAATRVNGASNAPSAVR